MAEPSEIVNQTIAYIKENDADLYATLMKNPSKHNQINHMIVDLVNQDQTDNVALQHVNIEDEIAIKGALKASMPVGCVKLIEVGLQIPTYKIDLFQRLYDKKFISQIIRDQKFYANPTVLDTEGSVLDSTVAQWASLILEGIMLVMSVVGIVDVPGQNAIDGAIEEITEVVASSSAVQTALKDLQNIFSDASSSNYQKAKAIFDLLKATKAAGILWSTIKALCSNMSWWQWLKTAALVTAQILAALATDGLALIGKIVLALNAAYDFIKKIVNLNTLDSIKTAVQKQIASSTMSPKIPDFNKIVTTTITL